MSEDLCFFIVTWSINSIHTAGVVVEERKGCLASPPGVRKQVLRMRRIAILEKGTGKRNYLVRGI